MCAGGSRSSMGSRHSVGMFDHKEWREGRLQEQLAEEAFGKDCRIGVLRSLREPYDAEVIPLVPVLGIFGSVFECSYLSSEGME